MKKRVRDFLDSGLNEIEYFSPDSKDCLLLDKAFLITLRDYLAFLKSQEDKFNDAIKDEIKSIQSKCDWVESVGFDGFQLQKDEHFITSGVKVNGLGFKINMYYDETLDEYLSRPFILPRFLCLREQTKQKRDLVDSLDKVQPELENIEMAGQQFFNGLLTKESASSEFGIYYEPFDGLFLQHGDSTLAYFDMGESNYYGFNSHSQHYLNEDYQKQALDNVLVRKL